MTAENSGVRFSTARQYRSPRFSLESTFAGRRVIFVGLARPTRRQGSREKTLEVPGTSKKTRHPCQNTFGWLRFASEPGGQGDPGNANFGSDVASVVCGFAQVAPQGVADVLRVHSIFIRLLIRHRISAS